MFFQDEESSEIGRPAQTKLESFLFSCELSSKVPFYTFQGDEEEDLEHFLELRTICLGEGAKEESNVVEVTAMNHQGKTISVPIANLHVSCLPMVSLGEFELKAPVTIRLKAGVGPVSVSGLHLIVGTAFSGVLSTWEPFGLYSGGQVARHLTQRSIPPARVALTQPGGMFGIIFQLKNQCWSNWVGWNVAAVVAGLGPLNSAELILSRRASQVEDSDMSDSDEADEEDEEISPIKPAKKKQKQ